jgi:hypothetical protein
MILAGSKRSTFSLRREQQVDDGFHAASYLTVGEINRKEYRQVAMKLRQGVSISLPAMRWHGIL